MVLLQSVDHDFSIGSAACVNKSRNQKSIINHEYWCMINSISQEIYRLKVAARIRKNSSRCNHGRSTYRSMSPEQFSISLEWPAECENIGAIQRNPVHLNLNDTVMKECLVMKKFHNATHIPSSFGCLL